MILYKNHFKDTRHHLTVTIQTRIMLKNKVILTFLVIGFLAFENCQAFYRPMPSFIENTLNKILHDQLERRFGELTDTTAETPTTTMVESATSSATMETTLRPKTPKVKLCRFKTFEACSLDEWTSFLKHVLKNQRRLRFKENEKPVSPRLLKKRNFKLGHRLMAFQEKRKKTI